MPSIPRITHTQINFIAHELRAPAAFLVTVQDTSRAYHSGYEESHRRGWDGLEPDCH